MVNQTKKIYPSLIGPENPFHKRKKFIGGYIPNQVMDLFSLICVLEGKSRTKKLTEMIEAYCDSYGEENVMKALCDNALEAWNETLALNEGSNGWRSHQINKRWREYVASIKQKFEKLPDVYVHQIIRFIENAKF